MVDCFLCFLCLSPETSKIAEGISDGLADFRWELVLIRKYDNTSIDPRNEGFTLWGCFIGFRLKTLSSDDIYYELSDLFLDVIESISKAEFPKNFV